MAESQSAKRARSNTIGDVHIGLTRDEVTAPQLSAEEISMRVQDLNGLNPRSIIDIVKRAAQTHPDVMEMVNSAIHTIHEKERNRVLSFDHYSSSIWKSINVTYRSMRGSQQYDIAWDVAAGVVEDIKSIAKQCGLYASPQTRFNGLSVLRKIGKTIALSSNDTVGHEVQKTFQYDASLVDAMLEIVESMEPDEVRAIGEDESSPEALWPKLQELEDLAHDYCIHPGIEKVLDLIVPRDAENEDEYDAAEPEEEDQDHDDDENEDHTVIH